MLTFLTEISFNAKQIEKVAQNHDAIMLFPPSVVTRFRTLIFT